MATIARVMYDVVARDGASRTFRRIGDDATFAEGRVARFGKAFAVAGGVVAAAAIAVGVESVRMATTFQAQMTRIQTQAGGSARDVKVLTGAVLDLASRRAQQSPQMLAQSLYHLKSVGMDNVHAMKALRAASDLAAVGGANLEDTTNALAGAWRSGIKGGGSFAHTAATVNAIIGAGNMQMADFVQSLSSGILPAARTFHVSLSSVGSAMALMTDEGIPAEVAATRLRMTLSLMGAPSSKAIAALNSIGLSAGSLARKMMQPGPAGGLVGAVALLKQHLDASGLSAVKQAQVIAHAFGGGRSSSAIETLLNNLGVLQRKQEQINSTISKYGSDVAAQRKTAGAEFDRLRAIIDTVGIRIGLALLPPVTGFVSFIVNRAVPAVGGFASKVSNAFNAIIPVGAIKHDWQSLLQWLGLSKPKPVRLVTGDLLHLPKPAPLFAGDLIHPQPFHFAGADLFHPLPKSAGQTMASSIRSSLASALSGSSMGSALGGALGKAFASISQHSAVIVANLVKALASLDWVNIGKQVGGNAIGFAIGFASNLGADLFSGSFWEHHWWDAILAAVSIFGVGKFGGLIARMLEHIPVLRMFAPLFRGLESVTKPVTSAVGKILGAIGRGLLDGFKTIMPRAGAFLERELGGQLIGRIVGAAGVIKYDMIVLGRGMLDGIERGTSGLVKLIGRIIGDITSPFRKAGSWLVNSGINVVRGLLSGIRRYMAGIASWVKGNIVDPIVHWVTHFFGISSPSKVMFGLGSHIMTGLLHGIVAGGRNLGGMVRHIFGSIPKALGHLIDKGFVSVTNLPMRALKALGGLGGKILGGFGDLLSGFLGGGSGGSVSGNAALGKKMAAAVGWTGANWSALFNLWQGESGWSNTARNPTSGAFGIPQALPPGKMGAAAVAGSAAAQIAWGLGYIRSVYGSPLNAFRMWLSRSPHWYGKGGAITEPVIGIGMRSGHGYGFGESGIEDVIPRSGPGARGVKSRLTAGSLVTVQGDLVVQDATDAELVARKLAFRTLAAGMGGNG